jgi:hypothetical protein
LQARSGLSGQREFDRLDQRFRREWLGQIRDASGLQRRHPGHVIVVAGDVDYRQCDAGSRELASQVDAGCIIQVDIDNDAKCLAEMVVIEQGLGGIEQDGFETVFAKKAFHASPHRRIVIDDKNGFWIWQIDIPQAEIANKRR